MVSYILIQPTGPKNNPGIKFKYCTKETIQRKEHHGLTRTPKREDKISSKNR